MTALFINIKIDQQEKLNLFKVTLKNIESVFDECHIKIRGELADECITFANSLFSDRATFYQNIQETDWIAATLLMIENVKARSIFSYLEDHKLLTSPKNLGLILKEFDERRLDYLCYSFFRASRLDIKNLLPLNPHHGNLFSEFLLNKENIKLIGKISPYYFTFSLASICSAHYFKKLLNEENKKFKIYLRKLSTLLSIVFRYPKNRVIINFINFFISFINLRLCFYPPNCPFNMERMNQEMTTFEIKTLKNKWKFGILKDELFANFDDDNTAYGESLIKRGLYPLEINNKQKIKNKNNTSFHVKLNAGDLYDCSYYSQIHRIRTLPGVFINVNYGKLIVNYNSKNVTLKKNDHQGFYTNLSPVINCVEDAEFIITVYDECFE